MRWIRRRRERNGKTLATAFAKGFAGDTAALQAQVDELLERKPRAVFPSPWEFALLALAVYRVWRIAAEDDLPPLPEWRNRVVGARETAGVWTFDRPTLAHMIRCPFCLGFHVSWVTWLLWRLRPKATATAATPFALSAAAALIAKNLDR